MLRAEKELESPVAPKRLSVQIEMEIDAIDEEDAFQKSGLLQAILREALDKINRKGAVLTLQSVEDPRIRDGMTFEAWLGHASARYSAEGWGSWISPDDEKAMKPHWLAGETPEGYVEKIIAATDCDVVIPEMSEQRQRAIKKYR